MNNRKQYVFGVKPSPLGTIGSILTFAIILFGIYYLIKGAYFVLGIIAPVLLIATLVIDHKVVTGYLKTLYELLKKNPIMGILAILMTVIGSPFVAGYLFAKALMKRSLKKFVEERGGAIPNSRQEGFSDYEEVVEVEEDFLILPDVEAPKAIKKDKNDYDDLFK